MSGGPPVLSIVTAAYNAADTIGATLRSVYAAAAEENLFEVLVVDDGSGDAAALREVVAAFPGARLVVHPENRGMCAARNSGIAASRGAFVTILDADDAFVPNWPRVFKQIVDRLPPETNLCFSACRTPDGRATVTDARYEGRLDTTAFLRERYAGEYLPIFRGDYVRAKPYVDLGLRKSCGSVSYLAWLQDAPFYVVPDVLRLYDDRRATSVSGSALRRNRAVESVQCLEEELTRYADLYQAKVPGLLERKLLRLAVYARLAGDPCAWRFFRRGASLRAPIETIGCLAMMLGGRAATAIMVRVSKRVGLIKRYG